MPLPLKSPIHWAYLTYKIRRGCEAGGVVLVDGQSMVGLKRTGAAAAAPVLQWLMNVSRKRAREA
jgi:hypothetical protein